MTDNRKRESADENVLIANGVLRLDTEPLFPNYQLANPPT
jgi:hypothetical protein